MFLAIDIGNSNIVIGLFENNQLSKQWRFISNSNKNADDYAVDIIECFLVDKIDCLKIQGAIIASVVPKLSEIINSAIKKFLNEDVKILAINDKKTKLNIEIKLNNKSEIGDDRLINAIAGYKKFGGNLIIIDLGTATTFDAVGENGEYLGGVICPGINLSIKALSDACAKLPKINLKRQNNIIGKNTVEAMNSGIYYGYISLIEGLIKKIEDELNIKTTRIITGGIANIFKEALQNSINYHEADLTLEGLKIVYLENI
jgi:type III pantothenate kinase